MAFELYEKKATGATKTNGKSAPSGEGRRGPWVQFIKTGKPDRPGYMLIFGAVALEKFGLAWGDKIRLGFDASTGQVGIRKDVADSDQGLILGRHGNSERRLRASVTKFFRAYPELVNLHFPHKVDARKGRNGWIVFDTRPSDEAKRPVGRPRKVDAPVSVAVTKRGPGRPRKVDAPVSVVVKKGQASKTEAIPAPKKGRGNVKNSLVQA